LTLQPKDADIEDQGADDNGFDEDKADSFVHEAGISAKKEAPRQGQQIRFIYQHKSQAHQVLRP